MSVDRLGTSCDQCRSMVQYIFTSTETRRLVRTDSPGRPPRLCLFIIIHSSYIALFSALEQTHCAHWHVIVNEWLYPFIARIINIHGSGVPIALFGCFHGWCHVKCCRFGASSVYTIQPCTRLHCHFIQSHISVCVFSCNLPPALLAEWPGSFTCYCGNTGVERIPK